jgi:hypothetical protein
MNTPSQEFIAQMQQITSGPGFKSPAAKEEFLEAACTLLLNRFSEADVLSFMQQVYEGFIERKKSFPALICAADYLRDAGYDNEEAVDFVQQLRDMISWLD